MTTVDPIPLLYEEMAAVSRFLAETAQPSHQIFAESHFRKVLLLSIASFFERAITSLIEEFAQAKSSNCDALVSFVVRKALKRNYHTMFVWEGPNANAFFGLFGDVFKKRMIAIVANDAMFADAVKRFLELGHLRNQLVHENFALFPIELTLAEIYGKYQTAMPFLSRLSSELHKP